MLNAQQVDVMQNAEATNWDKFNQELVRVSDENANRFAMDNRLHVRFFMKPMINLEKSQEANRAIYEDREMIEIMIPGDKQNIVCHVVEDFDRNRFPGLYERFKAGREQVIGTPLIAAGFLSPAQCEEYRFFNVITVEQLANAADSVGNKFMGFHDHKRKAKEWLERATGVEALRDTYNADMATARAENEDLKQRLTALEEIVNQSAGKK